MLTLHHFSFNPFQENTYVLTSDQTKEALIIDPGAFSAYERQSFDQFLEDYTPVAILNTHAHLDHVFGVNHLIAKYDIPFYLHPLEDPILRNVPEVSLRYGIGTVPPIDQYTAFEADQFEFAGHQLTIVHTPGHAPGHISILLPDQQMAIVGDVLFRESVGRTDFPYCSFKDLERSIREKLYTLPDDTVVYAGHGMPTTIGHEKKHNPFVRP